MLITWLTYRYIHCMHTNTVSNTEPNTVSNTVSGTVSDTVSNTVSYTVINTVSHTVQYSVQHSVNSDQYTQCTMYLLKNLTIFPLSEHSNKSLPSF